MRHRLRRVLPLLSLLLAAALAPGAGSPPARPAARTVATTGDAAARKALDAVVARYRSLAAYRLEGQATSESGGSQGVNQSMSSMRFVVRRPGHFASEVRSGEMTTQVIADG